MAVNVEACRPGNNLMRITSLHILVWIFNPLLHRPLKSTSWRIFNLTPDVTRGGKFLDANALKWSALILVVRFPLNNLYSKYKPTSLMTGLFLSCKLASWMAVMRFSLASVRKSPMGSWEPVKITGLFRFSSIKLKAEAE